jgi:hypothetical protein
MIFPYFLAERAKFHTITIDRVTTAVSPTRLAGKEP